MSWNLTECFSCQYKCIWVILNLGQFWTKSKSPGQIWEKPCRNHIFDLSNLTRMFMLSKSRASLNLDGLGSRTRSPGFKKHFFTFWRIHFKYNIVQNLNIYVIFVFWSLKAETRSQVESSSLFTDIIDRKSNCSQVNN